MFFVILALVEEGDEVFLPNPAFPIHESMVDFVGGRPVFVELRQENGVRFDLDEFRAGLGERTKLVILNSPANPTGGVLTPEDIAGPQDSVLSVLAEFRVRRDLIVSGLNELPGVECIEPQGAFYAFPRIDGTGHDAGALADLLLGEGHVRFSYAGSQESITRALERMGEILSRVMAG